MWAVPSHTLPGDRIPIYREVREEGTASQKNMLFYAGPVPALHRP
jgi:hypothetical protein